MLTLTFVALSLFGSPSPTGGGVAERRRGLTLPATKQEIQATLENEPMLVRLVAAPKNPERGGVFVYRRRDGAWVPRFLGSGFSTLTIDSIAPGNPGLILSVHDASGPSTLHCDFHGFPLECR
jgi:hypothetical protein